jgi:glycerate kinase
MLLAAPDKFRGTVTARQVSASISRGAAPLGWSVREVPLSDGGEGLLDALSGLGGTLESVQVEGPLGGVVDAAWLRIGGLAVVEMAQASGLALVGGAEGNDAVRATTRGTGQLIVTAARALAGLGTAPRQHGAAAGDRVTTVVVGLGGSATTDGGRGALEVIEEAGGLGGVELVGACDVDVGFVEAADRFGPQKGATPDQVVELAARLEVVAGRYADAYGVDVRSIPGTGAAGGFGGAIVALGGRLRSGYEVVTELLGFRDLLHRSQLVVTGEGALDATSLLGKVVGSVLTDASQDAVPVLVIAGRASPDTVEEVERLGATVVSLSERFGAERAIADTARCIEETVVEYLANRQANS